MGYKKVYYDDIYALSTGAAKLCESWMQDLNGIEKTLNDIIQSDSFKGKGADSIKKYLQETYINVLIPVIGSCIAAYHHKIQLYYGKYERTVDAGDGKGYEKRYTTIVKDEVKKNGTVWKKLAKIITDVASISQDAEKAVKDARSFLTGIPIADATKLYEDLDKAIKKATTLDDKVEKYEKEHKKDLVPIQNQINEIRKLIQSRVSQDRKPAAVYKSGDTNALLNIPAMQVNMDECSKAIIDCENDGDWKYSVTLTKNREALIHKEAVDSRKWMKWVSYGAGVLGTAAITLASGGVFGVIVGATVGVTTASIDACVDNYIENGSFTENMDWNEYRKKCLISGITKSVTGGIGGLDSKGAQVKSIKDVVLQKGAESIVTHGAEGLAEYGYDVVYVIASGGNGETILKVINEGSITLRNNFISGVTGDVLEGYIDGQFSVIPKDRTYLEKLMIKGYQKGVGAFAKNGTNLALESFDCAIYDKDAATRINVFVYNTRNFTKDLVNGELGAFSSVTASTIADKVTGSSENRIANIAVNTISKTTIGGVTDGANSVFTKYLDYKLPAPGEANNDYTTENGKFDLGKAIKDSFTDKDKWIKSGISNLTDETAKEINQKSFAEKMKDRDYDKNGNVEVVTFGNDYSNGILYDDYQAAKNNAGKGEYKDMSVQDILGLPKDTDVSENNIRIRSVSTDNLSEAKSELKTKATKVTINNK